jgi:hypothetical protein
MNLTAASLSTTLAAIALGSYGCEPRVAIALDRPDHTDPVEDVAPIIAPTDAPADAPTDVSAIDDGPDDASTVERTDVPPVPPAAATCADAPLLTEGVVAHTTTCGGEPYAGDSICEDLGNLHVFYRVEPPPGVVYTVRTTSGVTITQFSRCDQLTN